MYQQIPKYLLIWETGHAPYSALKILIDILLYGNEIGNHSHGHKINSSHFI